MCELACWFSVANSVGCSCLLPLPPPMVCPACCLRSICTASVTGKHAALQRFTAQLAWPPTVTGQRVNHAQRGGGVTIACAGAIAMDGKADW